MFQPRFWILVAMIIVPAGMRIVEHPWNLAPVGALALFAGAHFRQKSWALVVPLAAMLLSDAALSYRHNDWSHGFHQLMPLVYGCYAVSVLLGMGVQWSWSRRGERRLGFLERWAPVGGATLLGSLLFYLVTNFGVWAAFNTYPKSFEGLVQCYIAALPYFRTTLASDACYVVVLFGGYALLADRLPAGDGHSLLHAEQA